MQPSLVPSKAPRNALRVLAIGDVIGEPGKSALLEHWSEITRTYAPDLILLNGENAADGRGMTEALFNFFLKDLGVHVVTTGNHWHDKREVYSFLSKSPELLVPSNMNNVNDPMRGVYFGKIHDVEFVVVNLIGKVFMHAENRCPFKTVSQILSKIPDRIKIRILDIHAEASSEKQALAHYLRSKFSLIYGTHTHCPTADEQILSGHTGYLTDIGMTGAYDSVIGMDATESLNFFLTGVKTHFQPATKNRRLFALIADINIETGQCLALERVIRNERSPT